MSLRETLILETTDRVTFFDQIVCRPTRKTADGYSFLVLEDPAGVIFVAHEEILHLLVSGQMLVEAGYFSAIPSEPVSTRYRPHPMRSAQQNHPGNGTVH